MAFIQLQSSPKYFIMYLREIIRPVNISSYSSNAKIYNNVFYDNRQGISSSYAEVSLFNNIFYMTKDGDQALHS